jgi:hypothetical protein
MLCRLHEANTYNCGTRGQPFLIKNNIKLETCRMCVVFTFQTFLRFSAREENIIDTFCRVSVESFSQAIVMPSVSGLRNCMSVSIMAERIFMKSGMDLMLLDFFQNYSF